MQTEALLKEPSLDPLFPLEFQNGFRIATLGFWCRSCKIALPLSEVHGQVSRILERVVDISAAASCSCGELNSYRIRLHDDASCSYVKAGRWVTETRSRGRLKTLDRIRIQLLFLSIRWKCYWLTRSLKHLQRNFRDKYGLHQDPQ
jgi:hypothetical protein